MARKQRGVGGLSKEQLYNFVKVKGSHVVTDFNHDPAKNANSVILKYGTGDTADDESGKVRSGYVYYLNSSTGVWTQAQWNSEGNMGTGQLLGIALGKFPEYAGTPENVGMLISGVTTTSILGVANAGTLLYGSGAVAGRMQAGTGGVTITQKMGHSLGQQQAYYGGVLYYETLVLFNPDLSYTT